MRHSCVIVKGMEVDSVEQGAEEGRDVSMLAVTNRDQIIVLVLGGGLGLALGIAAPYVIGWALTMDWLPFQGPMRMLEALSSRVGSWILILVGLVAGVLIALGIVGQLAKVQITDRDVTFIRGNKKQRFARSQVALALIDEKHLVLRDERDVDLVREELDVSATDVTEALQRHGWPIEE